VFTYEQIHTLGSPSVEVEVFHKNSEDIGVGSSAGTISGSIGTVRGTTNSTFLEETISSLKELVRYRIILSEGSAGDGVVYRFHQPSWFNTLNA
jgi:hypothetical protein